MPKFTLAFGLLNIPVKTCTAAREERTSFNMLSPCCKTKTKQDLTCAECGEPVERGKTLKGYPIADGQWVVVTPEELKTCEPESSKVMEIVLAVNSSEIDPMLLCSSYYLEPEAAGKKGYALLLAALQAEGMFAIAKVTMSSREHIAIIRPYDGVLAFHTMYMAGEIRSTPALGLESITLKDAELELARKLLQVNAGPFEHEAYSDSYMTAVEDLLRAKQEGKSVTVMPKKATANTTGDLLAALTASLQSKANPGAPAGSAAKPGKRKTA